MFWIETVDTYFGRQLLILLRSFRLFVELASITGIIYNGAYTLTHDY